MAKKKLSKKSLSVRGNKAASKTVRSKREGSLLRNADKNAKRETIRKIAKSRPKPERTSGEIQYEFHKELREATEGERSVTFPIAGIGASAGGVEALSELFKHVPVDTGVGFVVIQHMAANQESMLPEILSRVTTMPVKRADHLMPVEPNTVYVITPNRSLGIINGAIRTMPRMEPRHQHMPIDFFFRCLAEDQRSNSIGVILSGGDSDGTQGLSYIKSEGGVTFCQDPLTAKVPSMPQAAMRNKAVDFVLPLDEIAEELARLTSHPMLAVGPSAVEILPNDESQLATLFRIVRLRTGVDFSLYKRPTLLRRLKRRIILHKVRDLGEYVEFLEKKPEEIDSLMDDLLINVTNFFRDPEVFQGLGKKVFPRLLEKRSPDDPIRIWVPGCATGEEVYSIAITLFETIFDLGVNFPVQIFATDLSESAIQKARSAIYPGDIRTDVSPDRLRRFFVYSEGMYQVSRAIRDVCIFAKHDVTRDPPFSRMDFVSCRNLLIYLGPELQKRVIQTFAYALNPGGQLLLGSSESAGASSDLFTLTDKPLKIYTRKPTLVRAQWEIPAYKAPFIAGSITIPDRIAKRKRLDDGQIDLKAEMSRILIEKFDPACVAVTEDFQIMQFIGDTSPYLEHQPGEASLNLLKLARNGLQLEIRAALQKAKMESAPVVVRGVAHLLKKSKSKINLEVYPLDVDHDRFYLIFFEDIAKRKRDEAAKDNTKSQKTQKHGQAIKLLQDELATTSEYLKTSLRELEMANEELQSANEEILSSNEELQSTNEELETAKEELQSSNEELTTVNEELSTRNTQLSQVNDDLKNLLASINIPMVMVGNDLRIRRFTPQAERLLNVIPSDVGRPITDFNPNFNLPNLQEMILTTIDSMTPAQADVTDQDDRKFTLRIRPYRTSDNKIDGAVLIFFETELVRQLAVVK